MGKTLIVAGCSVAHVDNYAVDWIIQSLGLLSVAVMASEFVDPSIQPQAFPDLNPETETVTSSIELYAKEPSPVAVIQIRSRIYATAAVADEIVAFARDMNAERIVVVGGAMAYYMTGESLEQDQRLRAIGAEETGYPSYPLEEMQLSGVLRQLIKRSSATLPVVSLLMLVSGHGFEEICLRSEKLARAVLKFLKLDFAEKPLAVPLSIQQLRAPPRASAEARRIL